MPAGCLVLALRMDRATRASTAFVLFGVSGALALAVRVAGVWTAIAAAVPVFTVLLAAFMVVPRYAVVQGDELVLVAPARTVEVRVRRVLGVVDLGLPDVRLRGFGGFLGYVGVYRVRGLGRCRVYSRRRRRLTALETEDGEVVLVGLDPEVFGGVAAP